MCPFSPLGRSFSILLLCFVGGQSITQVPTVRFKEVRLGSPILECAFTPLATAGYSYQLSWYLGDKELSEKVLETPQAGSPHVEELVIELKPGRSLHDGVS